MRNQAINTTIREARVTEDFILGKLSEVLEMPVGQLRGMARANGETLGRVPVIPVVRRAASLTSADTLVLAG